MATTSLILGDCIDELKKLGYKNLICGDSIFLPIEHLSDTSKEKINVICDICYDEFEITYYNFYKNNYFEKCYCKKCKLEKSTGF